jgi:hypothetical protein
MSGFKHLPSQDEVMRYDPNYISDMQLALLLYQHQSNNSAYMRIVDTHMTKEKEQEALSELGLKNIDYSVYEQLEKEHRANFMSKKQASGRHQGRQRRMKK